jgi:hypothetical protein
MKLRCPHKFDAGTTLSARRKIGVVERLFNVPDGIDTRTDDEIARLFLDEAD